MSRMSAGPDCRGSRRSPNETLPWAATAADSTPVKASLNGHPGYCLTRLAFVGLLPSQWILKQLLLSWAGPYVSARFNFCASSFEGLLDASAETGRSSVASVISLINPPPGMPPIPAILRSYLIQLPIFIEITPVYSGGHVPISGEARIRALAGWTMGVFDASKILGPALANASDLSLVLTYDSAGSKPMVIAHSGRPQFGAIVKRLTFPADPGWVIVGSASSRTGGPSPLAQALAVLFGSLALTLLLVIVLSMLLRSRRSALELVEKRTAELRHRALYDSLTGLPNRHLVNQTVHQLLRRAHSEGLRIAVFFIDLDDFKNVNDTLGHGAGDELLRAVATRLSASVRDCDTVGRLGGDEFVVLSEVSDEGLSVVAERLLQALREPVRLADATSLSTTASIGIATGLYDSPEELLRDADTAMYRAKSMGKNRYVTFRPEMHEALRNQLSLDADLSEAFSNRQFFLVYQPIVDLESGLPTEVEALLRWRHPERGLVGAADFIHDARVVGPDHRRGALRFDRSLPASQGMARPRASSRHLCERGGPPAPLRRAHEPCQRSLGDLRPRTALPDRRGHRVDPDDRSEDDSSSVSRPCRTSACASLSTTSGRVMPLSPTCVSSRWTH